MEITATLQLTRMTVSEIKEILHVPSHNKLQKALHLHKEIVVTIVVSNRNVRDRTIGWTKEVRIRTPPHLWVEDRQTLVCCSGAIVNTFSGGSRCTGWCYVSGPRAVRVICSIKGTE